MINTRTKIALATPFEGAPSINIASIIGASPKKPLLFRIPVSGKRPMEYSVSGLPQGVLLNENIISGTVENEGKYELVITAKNVLGEAKKTVTLEIAPQNVLVTPLLGYTTWNAFASRVSQKAVEGIATRLVDLGISEYGYSYVNTDSGWQGEYGGEFDAVMPNEKFPSMKEMTDKIHALGLKCGIYSTPMLNAWGCPENRESIPGCTVGEADYRFASTNGGIGLIRKERNNALQWEKWGFDYLKYDWAPTDTVNAELMRRELVSLERDFGFCVTVKAIRDYWEYFTKYCSSFRSNEDTLCNFTNLVKVYESYFEFGEHFEKGHFFDLDMLDFGTCNLETLWRTLTDDEKIMEYSMRAFLSSPIQISSTLEDVSDFELSVYCNEEIIAINQDCTFKKPTVVKRIKEGTRYIDVLEKELEDGTFAYAIFNLGFDENVKMSSNDQIRDLWAKENLGKDLSFLMTYRSTRMFKSKSKITFEI